MLILSALVLITALVFIDRVLSSPNSPNWSKVVFFVSWYDVGEDALEGLKGVKLVNNGFLNFKETNTVWYDPAVIRIDEMEQALKDAGTFLGTAKWSACDNSRIPISIFKKEETVNRIL